MKKLFVIGLNGVLYDSVGRVLEYLRHRWNYIVPRDSVTTTNLATFTGVKEIDIDLIKQLKNPDFYQDMKPFDHAWEALTILSKYGNIVSITRRPANTRMITRICATRDFGPYIKEIYHQKNGPKAARALKASLVVEDNPDVAEQYASGRIVTFCPIQSYSKPLTTTRFLKPCLDLLQVAKEYDSSYSRTSWDD